MKIGYCRVSTSEQNLDLQKDELLEAGVEERNIYSDTISGKTENRTGLDSCLQALREGDVLVVWKLDRLGRSLKHLIEIVESLNERRVGFKVLTGSGSSIDTTSASGCLIFSIFGAFAEFERNLISERTKAGLKSARARGRKGGRKYKLSKAQVRLLEASVGKPETNISELCNELDIKRTHIYKYVSPKGELREYGKAVLGIVD